MGSALGAFAGLARGAARAYGRHLDRQEQIRQEDRADKLREFQLLFPKAMESAELTGDYAGAEDFIGQYFPKTQVKTSARRAAAKAAKPRVGAAPSLVADPSRAVAPVEEPTGPSAVSTDIGALMQHEPGAPAGMQQPPSAFAGMPAGPAPIQNRSTITAGTPAPEPQPSQNFFGIQMPTPAERRQIEVDAEIDKLEQTRTRQVALARRILPKLQADDPSITLEDAMRYVTKGDLMSNASQRGGAGAYRYGVDREAIAKAIFGRNYDTLDRHEADIVLREEKQMLEQEAFSRGTGTGKAAFNKPADLKTAQDTGVAVGTSAADVANKVIPTEQQRERRQSVEELQANLIDIRDNLLKGALPTKAELGGKAPGLAYAARRRGLDPTAGPDQREKVAALESRINNVVNVMARSVGQQRGTQTERDALRAEAAIAQIHDALTTGDTVESATVRINDSLKVLESILGRLPVVPAKAGGGGAAAPGTSTTAPPAGRSTAVKQGNTWVIETTPVTPPAGQPQPTR